MNLLAIDTTGPDCSVALRQPGAADRLVSERIGRGHAERLAPMVRDLLAEAGLAARLGLRGARPPPLARHALLASRRFTPSGRRVAPSRRRFALAGRGRLIS